VFADAAAAVGVIAGPLPALLPQLWQMQHPLLPLLLVLLQLERHMLCIPPLLLLLLLLLPL
jgi:hypothetical protein